MTDSGHCVSGTEHSDEWKIAEITLNQYGPQYLIRGENLDEFADRVEFNGFRLGLDGRAEVEYKRLEFEDGGFSSTAKFFDHSLRTDNDPSEEVEQ